MPNAADDLGAAGSPRFIRAVAVLLILAGVGLAALRFIGASPAEDGLEGALGSVALGAPVVATGVLALLALRGRAVLLIPAALVLVPMSFLSFALVTLPLLIPAVMLFMGYQRRAATEPLSATRVVATLMVVTVFLIAAVAVLFVHEDPRHYATPTESGSTSDIITSVEALVSLALTTTGVIAGWTLSPPPVSSG